MPSSASSSLPPGYGTVSSINFTGGFPDSTDLAPSIIFAILYFASIPVIAWRLISARHRTAVLIRPAIFVVVRVAMLVLRAVMSKSNYGIQELIAELVLVGVGYLFVLEPLTQLWKRLVRMATEQRPYWVLRIELLLRVALFASIVTIAVSGGLTVNAFDSTSMLNTVIALRHASYCISLAVVGINCIALAVTYVAFRLPTRQTLFLIPPHIALLIVGVYRVAQTFEMDASSGIRGKAAFWVMEILFEFVAYAFFLSVSIPEFFPKPVQTVTETPASHTRLNNAERGQSFQMK